MSESIGMGLRHCGGSENLNSRHIWQRFESRCLEVTRSEERIKICKLLYLTIFESINLQSLAYKLALMLGCGK